MQCTVEDIKTFVKNRGILNVLTEVSEHIHKCYLDWHSFNKQERIATYFDDGPLELMPISNTEFYAVKYVNCHNKNPDMFGIPSVVGVGIYASTLTGHPLLISEMTILTAIRTAATSALVGKYLMPEHSKAMAIIGNGAQCEFQALAFHAICNIGTIYLFDVDTSASEKVKKNLPSHLTVKICESIEQAVEHADIITTCTNVPDHACLIPDHLLTRDVHINAVGGDRPGKTELDPRTLERAQIFVEYEPQTRIEGEIQNSSVRVTELCKLFANQCVSRNTITVFDSVGFALEDFSVLQYVYNHLDKSDSSAYVVKLDHPKDLFGCLSN